MSQEGPILRRLLPTRTGGSYGHPNISGKHPATAPPPSTGTSGRDQGPLSASLASTSAIRFCTRRMCHSSHSPPHLIRLIGIKLLLIGGDLAREIG